MNLGDVILVRFPHSSGLRGKKRPAVIVQSDAYAGTVSTLVVAEVTKNPTMTGDPAGLFIDANTPEGKATGLARNSVVSCLVLVTVYADTVAQVLGTPSPAMKQKLDDSLKVALGLPFYEASSTRDRAVDPVAGLGGSDCSGGSSGRCAGRNDRGSAPAIPGTSANRRHRRRRVGGCARD